MGVVSRILGRKVVHGIVGVVCDFHDNVQKIRELKLRPFLGGVSFKKYKILAPITTIIEETPMRTHYSSLTGQSGKICFQIEHTKVSCETDHVPYKLATFIWQTLVATLYIPHVPGLFVNVQLEILSLAEETPSGLVYGMLSWVPLFVQSLGRAKHCTYSPRVSYEGAHNPPGIPSSSAA